MKLISMTDFVLQDNGNILNMEYANFLKQTLELGMFVTCDEEGNILDSSDQFRSCGKGFVYGQAKEKVLFEGCVYDDEMDAVRQYIGLMMYSVKYESNDTIEDLIKYDINLTYSAIKKLGL